MSLEILQAADEMVFDIPWVENAVVAFARYAEHTAEAFPGRNCENVAEHTREACNRT